MLKLFNPKAFTEVRADVSMYVAMDINNQEYYHVDILPTGPNLNRLKKNIIHINMKSSQQ